MGLFIFLSFALRSISLAGKYGLVPVFIPAVQVAREEPYLAHYHPQSKGSIDQNTVLVVLTSQEMIFGDLNSFTQKITDIRNKFIVPHEKGSPNIKKLIFDIEKWVFARSSKKKIANSGILVLLPMDEIPAPLVVQSIQQLQSTGSFEKIVLAGGML